MVVIPSSRNRHTTASRTVGIVRPHYGRRTTASEAEACKQCYDSRIAGGPMAKFLIKATYTTDGVRGLLKEGGTKRRAAVQEIIEAAGGKLEAFYYAYGADDAFIIADLPDATTGLAISLTVNASGAVRLSTLPLITPEELDAASKKSVKYRAPGA